MNRTLTFDEASIQAATLRKQGMSYPKIAEHLDKLGYISPKTRGRVGEQSVRNMVHRLEDKGPPPQSGESPPVKVRTPNMEVVEALRKIPTLGLSPQLTLKLVNTLLEGL